MHHCFFVIQVVGGPDLRIYDIVTGWPGSVCESRIFHDSSLKDRMENNLLQGNFKLEQNIIRSSIIPISINFLFYNL